MTEKTCTECGETKPLDDDEEPMTKPGKFTYRVVTSNGAGIHAKDLKRPKDARAVMERIAARYPFPAVFEIERVRHLPGNCHQCDMRQGSRWVPWQARRGPDLREPDWAISTQPQHVKEVTDA